MSTFGISRTGNGGTAADATTKIGSTITLPAGGPFIIHKVWAQVAKVTTVPNEGTGGVLVVDSVSGDITPDPSPGKWPLVGACISESANSAIAPVPLNIWDVNFEASGKAQLDLKYNNQLAITTASKVACGIIFGDTIPTDARAPFCAFVQDSFASATEQQLGSITLAEKATRITGILAVLNKGDAATAGEEIMGTIRLQSDSMKLVPAEFPCNHAFNASDGTAVGQPGMPVSKFIPVDIPVIGGAIIDVFATTTRSVTGNADVSVFLAYE
jgi:hypothetical protein